MKKYQIEYSLFIVGTKDGDEETENILETWINIDDKSIDHAHAQMEKIFDRCIDNLVTDEIQEEYDSISDIEDTALNILTINLISDDNPPEDKEVIHRNYQDEGYDDTDKYVKYHDVIWDAELAKSDDYDPVEVAVYDD